MFLSIEHFVVLVLHTKDCILHGPRERNLCHVPQVWWVRRGVNIVTIQRTWHDMYTLTYTLHIYIYTRIHCMYIYIHIFFLHTVYICRISLRSLCTVLYCLYIYILYKLISLSLSFYIVCIYVCIPKVMWKILFGNIVHPDLFVAPWMHMKALCHTSYVSPLLHIFPFVDVSSPWAWSSFPTLFVSMWSYWPNDLMS